MQIQVEKLYLFETSVIDPFFFGTKDGVSTQFSNGRTIQLLDIVSVYFFLDNIAKSGLTYSLGYGGEDTDIEESYGKSTYEYELEFNFPSFQQRLLEELVGKEFSILCMRRDLSFFVIFGRFVCQNLSIDNEVQQRLKFVSKGTNSKMYNVNSFNITTIENVVDEGDFINNGFDYSLDFALN